MKETPAEKKSRIRKVLPAANLPALFLLLLFFPASTALPAEAQKGLSVAVFVHADPGEGEASTAYLEHLSGALAARLAGEGFRVLPRGGGSSSPAFAAGDAGSGAAVLTAARALQADAAAVGSCAIQGRRLFIRIKLYDVRTGKLEAAAMEYGLTGLSGYNLVEEMVDRLGPEMANYRESYDPDEPLTDEVMAGLLLHSPDEGMEVAYESGAPFGRVEDGTIRPPYVPFRVGSSIDLIKSKPGHHPEVETVTVTGGINEVNLRPLARKFRHETSLYWSNGQSLGRGRVTGTTPILITCSSGRITSFSPSTISRREAARCCTTICLWRRGPTSSGHTRPGSDWDCPADWGW